MINVMMTLSVTTATFKPFKNWKCVDVLLFLTVYVTSVRQKENNSRWFIKIHFEFFSSIQDAQL